MNVIANLISSGVLQRLTAPLADLSRREDSGVTHPLAGRRPHEAAFVVHHDVRFLAASGHHQLVAVHLKSNGESGREQLATSRGRW